MDIKKVLDDAGLAILWAKIKELLGRKVDVVSGKGLSTNDYTNAEKTKLAGVSSGAQPNVLEGVQVNGATITPTNKIVNIPKMVGATSTAAGKDGVVPGGAAGDQGKYLRGDGTWAIPTNTTYGNMKGATSNAAGAAGLVPTPVAGKQAQFLRGDGTWAAPPNTTYGIGNSSTAGIVKLYTSKGSATDGSMTQAAITEEIAAAIRGVTSIDFQIVSSLPTTGVKGVIYLLAQSQTETANTYSEYIWIVTAGKFEKIGDTKVDLSNYYNTSSLVALSNSEINAICV